MASAGRKIGIGVMGIGLALAGLGVAAGAASAGTDEVSCSPSLTMTWGLDTDPNHVNVDNLVAGGSVVVSDGTLTVTLSNATPIPGQGLSDLTIGALDFKVNKPVDSIVMRLWQAPGDYDFTTVDYKPAVTSGHLSSPPGSSSTLGEAPIKGLQLCYEAEVVPTSTAAPTSTIAPTSTAAPTSVLPEQVTTTIPTEVLPQVETAPEIAFTGSETGPLVVAGGAMVLVGLALVGIDRAGLARKGRHTR